MIGVVSTLAVASLVSVGFAAWTILNPVNGETGITITADADIDEFYHVPANGGLTGQTASIVYGGPTNANNTVWLSWSGTDAQKDKLDFQFTYTFYARKNTVTAAQITTPAWTSASSTAWTGTSAFSHDIVGALPSFTKQLEGPVANTDNDTKTAFPYVYTLTLSGSFTWGSHFGSTSTNPYAYYNGQTKTSTLVDDAKASFGYLDSLNTASLALAFTFTINAPTA